MEQPSQRKTLFSNNFQKTNLVIGGCVRTTHADTFFAGGRRNYYNALIEIPLLGITIVAREFCHQQGRKLKSLDMIKTTNLYSLGNLFSKAKIFRHYSKRLISYTRKMRLLG